MAINKKFISFATQAQFDDKVAELDDRSIVFIEETKRIWTHGVFFDTPWNYIQNKPSTLDGYGITDAALKVNSLYYVEGNTSGTAGSWTGSIPEITFLYAGLTIAYKIGIAGASTTNLNINGYGNTLVRRNTSNLTTHLPVGTVVILTYDGTYWVWAYYDSDTIDRTYWYNTITAGAPIYSYKLLMQGLDGKFYPLTLETGTGTTKTVSTQEFEINSQILYYATTATVATNSTTANVYSEYPITTLSYTANQTSWTSQQLIYLKGTILSNGNFKLDNTSYTSFMTQTLPTSADGFVYVLLGYMYSSTAMRLFQYHPMYEYRDGALRVYIPIHSHGNITDGGNIGTVANKPIITGTGGILQAGSFGTTANTFAEGNDSRIVHGETAYSWGNHAGVYPSRASLFATANSIRTSDTRAVNQLPTTDLQNGVWFDFKQNSVIGLTGASTYSAVMTFVPYTDNSGNSNTAFRLAQSENNLYFQNWTTVWGTWNKIWHDGNFDPATKNASLVTSTTSSGVTNVTTGNTNTYLNIVQGGTSIGSSTQVTGAGSVTISSDTAGKLTITGSTAYLPLSGGTLTGSIYNILELNRSTAAGSSMLFSNSAGNLGKLGFDSSGNFQLGSGTSTDGVSDLMRINGSTQYVTFFGTVAAPTFVGALSGNATTATALTTSAGSTTQPVYFSGGKPVAATAYADASVNYATSAGSAGNASIADQVSNSFIIKFDSGTTENTNLYTFNGSSGKTINIIAGSNISMSKSANSITISATDSTYVHPTTSGNKHIPSGGTTGNILRWSADGTAVWGVDNDTHYTSGIRTGASGTSTNAAVTNPYIKVVDDSTYREQIRLVGAGATSISSDASGNITISSTDNNTTYGVATTSVNGLMSSTDKSKLDGLINYTHPTGDGNLHVPATGTTNNGKFLRAGSVAGSLAWYTLGSSDVGALSINGGTLTGIVTAQNNTSYTTKQVRNIIFSTDAPQSASMENGDIWIRYY